MTIVVYTVIDWIIFLEHNNRRFICCFHNVSPYFLEIGMPPARPRHDEIHATIRWWTPSKTVSIPGRFVFRSRSPPQYVVHAGRKSTFGEETKYFREKITQRGNCSLRLLRESWKWKTQQPNNNIAKWLDSSYPVYRRMSPAPPPPPPLLRIKNTLRKLLSPHDDFVWPKGRFAIGPKLTAYGTFVLFFDKGMPLLRLATGGHPPPDGEGGKKRRHR